MVKKELKKYIKHVRLLMTDFVQVIFNNDFQLVNVYIPPVGSVYYDEQYVELLCSVFIEAEETKVIAMGDLNARLGNLNSIIEGYSYQKNTDTTVNENGKHLANILFNTSSALPLNHLVQGSNVFDGGFTFQRNEQQKSQIDWCIVNNNSLKDIVNFQIKRDCPGISDHKPIVVEVNTKREKSLSAVLRAACNINYQASNHSKIPLISSHNTNVQFMENLLKVEIQNTDIEHMTSHDIALFLHNTIHSTGKIAKIPFNKRDGYQSQLRNNRCEKLESELSKEERAKWEYVMSSNDSKALWNSINMKGEIKPDRRDGEEIDVDDLARVCSSKSRIEVNQALFTDLRTDVTNADLDQEINESEVEEAVKNLNESKTSDGITAGVVRKILPTIMNLLLLLMNMIFKGGPDAYPSCWLNLVNALPKKGRLQLPKLVRFITVMGIFEKIYQVIISNRLTKFIKIPSPQSAYQKGKNCSLHVMTIRLMKALCKKLKVKLFVIFTDFESAFDLVSRRLLFEKLIKLGISSIMLSALIAIYRSGMSVVEHNSQFSDYLLLLAGVKQGAPPSGLLYIVYTMGLIDMYNQSFNPEPLINIYHMLVHADDILMLSTSKEIATKKMIALLKYCSENFIRLQILKCAFMCVNSDDPEDKKPLSFQNLQLKATTKEVYLGSVITDSTKFEDDVMADLKHRQISVVKFYAFLRTNKNAPVVVKTKCLDACSLTSLLYNSETWAAVRLDSLEASHRRMLKSIISIGMNTCNEFVYLELGALSTKTVVLIKQWKFWNNVVKMDDDNPLKYIIELGRRLKLKEIKHYDDLVERYSSVEEIIDNFYSNIRADIRKKAEQGRSKYTTYLKINPNLTTPEIYKNIKNQHHISMIGKLRTSSHSLHVEMGRRSGIAREARLCNCKEGIEDEEHFLLTCRNYTDIRQKHRILHTNINNILENANYTDYIAELYQRRKLMAEP